MTKANPTGRGMFLPIAVATALALSLLLTAPQALNAADSSGSGDIAADAASDIAELKEKYSQADEVRPTPVPGLYELRFGYRIAYVDATGQFAFMGSGDLQDVSNGRNLTESRREEVRRELVESLDEWDTLDFLPDDIRHELLVFTDVDCGYCRRLHQQMAEYHELGIGIRYVAFPRSGPDTDTWSTMHSIWCAKDRPAALTRAKAGGFVRKQSCDSSSVERHYDLGRDIGLTGTPALVTPDGRMIPGYVPPARLVDILNETPAGE